MPLLDDIFSGVVPVDNAGRSLSRRAGVSSASAPRSIRGSQAALMREKRAAERDIGELPPVSDPERRARCRESLLEFLLVYLSPKFTSSFSPDHLEFIAELQRIIIHGGKKAEAMPRGTGKTTIIEGAAAWALLNVYRRFLTVVVDSGTDCEKMRNNFKMMFDTNPLLLADYPEVCYPLRMLEGSANRANSQTYCGERTFSRWGSSYLVFPTLAGSAASGAVFYPVSLERPRRGLRHNAPSGETLRPDMVIIDDPQNRETARSRLQTDKREQVISADIMGLAGSNSDLAAVMACTVILDNDLAERFLSHDLHPEWQGTRHSLIKSWPDDLELWEEYRQIFKTEIECHSKNADPTRRHPRANAFYLDHRAALDSGCVLMWPDHWKKHEVSAIQSAMNRFFEMGPDAFASECQNEPVKKNTSLYRLTIPVIQSRVNAFPPRVIPPLCPFLFVAADINYYAISYAAGAYRNDFCGYVTSYGFWTGRDKGQFYDSSDATLNEEAAIVEGLIRFVEFIAREFPTVQVVGIDGNRFTAPVYKYILNYCRRFPFKLLPLRGQSPKQYREPARREERLIGAPRTRCHLWKGRHDVPEVRYDSSYWHVFMQRQWLLSPGVPRSLSLYGDASTNHRVFAEQITAETLIDYYERNGDMVYEWMTNGKNEMSDVCTMLAVLANLSGLDPEGIAIPAPARPARKPVVRNFNQ